MKGKYVRIKREKGSTFLGEPKKTLSVEIGKKENPKLKYEKTVYAGTKEEPKLKVVNISRKGDPNKQIKKTKKIYEEGGTRTTIQKGNLAPGTTNFLRDRTRVLKEKTNYSEPFAGRTLSKTKLAKIDGSVRKVSEVKKERGLIQKKYTSKTKYNPNTREKIKNSSGRGYGFFR